MSLSSAVFGRVCSRPQSLGTGGVVCITLQRLSVDGESLGLCRVVATDPPAAAALTSHVLGDLIFCIGIERSMRWQEEEGGMIHEGMGIHARKVQSITPRIAPHAPSRPA